MSDLSSGEIFYPYRRYLQETFGERTYKVVISGGMTCPTRDGSLSSGGCAFCDVRGSSSFFGKKGRGLEVGEQIRNRIPPIRERFGAKKFLAYFQSYTNTYDSVEELRKIYEAALSEPFVEGLCVGTRPDCLPVGVLELLEELAQNHYISLELGVQSFENPALEWLARGHSAECSMDALNAIRIRAPHVHTCVHLMFGTPLDSIHCARDAALILNDLGIRGAKLHQLMVLENTELARRYREKEFPTLSIEQYADVVIEFLDHLSPDIYVERLCANSTHPDECLAPAWSRERWTPHNRLRELMIEKNCRQGQKLAKN